MDLRLWKSQKPWEKPLKKLKPLEKPHGLGPGELKQNRPQQVSRVQGLKKVAHGAPVHFNTISTLKLTTKILGGFNNFQVQIQKGFPRSYVLLELLVGCCFFSKPSKFVCPISWNC